ncbi:BrnT family toxin [Treponema vincentii]|uniref:BrnT family toxin n=1 Tax=Treponema vincentii TaxID=69710 RepID=UPI0020A53B27|nr:BrnT family toxin [Treponema vincentii]UTC60444.1 BrnT family toxin [Treponema vincentii]
MTFEWDENKDRLNQKNHDGISFEYAARVFLDSKRIEMLDENHSDESEGRYNVIGCVERILFVVYTERGSDNIRIISARRATPKEEKLYYENYDIR